MTLVISKGITLAKTNNGIVDPDAIIYINNVEQVDGQNLEYGVAKAINDFVVGCKADGIWPAIKASCILAGARTLTGALVPLVGAAPTNFNFVSGDYNRKTGLVGDESTKYLNSNRNNNADPQNSQHISLYASNAQKASVRYIGSEPKSGSSTISGSLSVVGFRSRNSTTLNTTLNVENGFIGISRASSSDVDCRSNGMGGSFSQTSAAPSNETIEVFRAAGAGTNSRLAFYSIGESLDLALLDARVTDLINAIGAAIP